MTGDSRSNCLALAILLCSACVCITAIKVGVHGDSEIWAFLSGLNDTEIASRFNVTSFNVSNISVDREPTTVAEMRTYIESVRPNPPDVILGDYNATIAAMAAELGIPYYCTNPSQGDAALADTDYLRSSTLFIMNTYAENMIEASQKLINSVILRQTLIVVTNGISDQVNALLNSLSKEELHIVLSSNYSSSAEIRDALYNVSLRTTIDSAVFQTVFTSDGMLDMVLPEAASLSLMKNTTYWIVTDIFPNASLLLAYRRTGSTIFSFDHSASNITSISGLRTAMAEDAIGHYLKSTGVREFNLATALSTPYIGKLGAIRFDADTRRNRDSVLRIMATSSSLNYLDEFGVWNKNSSTGIKLTHGGLVNKLPNLKALVFMKEPFVMSSSTEYYGFCISVLTDLCSGLFTWEVVEVADESALLPMLRQRAGDLVINPMGSPLNGKLDTNVTYSTWPIMYTGVAAMGHAEDRERDYFSLLYPFSWNVWISVILAFIILSVTLYSIDKISPNDYKRPKFSISESVFFVYSSFMMSKLRSSAVKPSSRIFILILWFASLMYCTTYGTNSFFMLIRSNRELPFTSLSGLYNQSDRYYRMLVGNSSSMLILTAQPADSIYRSLAEPDALVDTEAQAVALVNNVTKLDGRRPVYIGDQAMIKYYAAKSCELKTSGLDELHQPMYLAMSAKLSPALVQAINQKIQVMSDHGVLDQYQDTYWSAVKCSSNENLINVSELQSVRIEQVAGIFIVLACALVFSFFVLLLEYASHQVQLYWQRDRVDPGLEFNKPYRAEVTSVTPLGIYVNVHDMQEYLPNQMLSPDPNKKMSAADLQICNSDFVEVVYLGNDPKTGDRLFRRIG